MTRPIAKSRGHEPESIPNPDISERSSLIKHPDTEAVYTIESQFSDTDDDSSDVNSFNSKTQDEESRIESPQPVGTAGHALLPTLSTKAILWIVLPLLLGQSVRRMICLTCRVLSLFRI